MQFPDKVRIFTQPLVADDAGGQSPGPAVGVYRTRPARISLLSAKDAHLEMGVSSERLWKVMMPPSTDIQFPTTVYYLSLYEQSDCPLLYPDRAYEIVKARHQRRAVGAAHHTSLVIKEGAITDPSLISYPNSGDGSARWAVEAAVPENFADFAIYGHRVSFSDYVTICVEDSGTRTIPQVMGRDFQVNFDGTLDISNISDILSETSVLWIVNYGPRPGIKWFLDVPFESSTQALTGTVSESDLIELVVQFPDNSRSLVYYSGRDFSIEAPDTLELSELDIPAGSRLLVTNFGSA
jgi:hypothetical protein